MKNKYIVWIVLVLLLVVGAITWVSKDTKPVSPDQKSSVESPKNAERSYLLAEFPLSEVPLYKMKMVSSSKFFVNTDPSAYEDYFGKPVNYFNVVFETEATPSEILTYYSSLMSERYTEFVPETSAEGKIGKYKVSISHYGDNPKNYAYLQVYMPTDEVVRSNRYFESYQGVVELDPSWTEYESSYGFLNQKGGEIEYTQYFPWSKENRSEVVAKYQALYQAEEGYSYDEKSGLMRFSRDGYSVALTFSEDHGRIYLMVRKNM